MISPKHECIFVHIPRTAGSSIENILWPGPRSVSELWGGVVEKNLNKYQTGGLQHLFAEHVRMEVGSNTFNQYFKFSFMRNPWDKAVSQFHYMRERKNLRKFIGMELDDSFKKYLALIQRKIHVQWDEQYKFISNENGDIMVDFLGRFENLEQDLNKVLNRLGVRMVRISFHRPYYEYYDDEAIGIVQSMYKRDIDMFGYEFHDIEGRETST
ncbi:MAG: sulfotransferase family 2 domain-containing protein [Deltaproteobacteria bacterium]|nr:sulfotransferase family 2 domain-containing protein [Deltaproteobacteria bacterium]